MNTILISTSRFETAIPNYFKYLGEEFRNNDFSIIYIFDGQIKTMPSDDENIKYFTYPNRRPTKLKDFIFLCRTNYQIFQHFHTQSDLSHISSQSFDYY